MDHTSVERATNVTSDMRTRQIRFGVVLFALSLAGAVVLRTLGVSSPVRYALFLPFLVGFYGIAIGLTGVCSLSAATAKRLTEEGSEPVADRGERKNLQRRGMFVMAAITLSAFAATFSLVR